MTTEAEYINTVRRKVSDYHTDVTDNVYADIYYQDSLAFGLSKLNNDWGTEFSTVADVTTSYYFLLVKLATIEMALVRSGEEPSGSAPQGSNMQQIIVPSLQIMRVGSAPSKTWLALAAQLQKEYDDELAKSGVDGSEVTVDSFTRVDLRSGGRRPYTLATTIDAPTLASSISGSDVTLTWDAILDEYFDRYEIWRGTDSDLSDGTLQGTLTDNHDEEFLDDGLASGTYYYQLRLYNRDELYSSTNTVSATVT